MHGATLTTGVNRLDDAPGAAELVADRDDAVVRHRTGDIMIQLERVLDRE